MFFDQSRHPPDIPLITEELISAENQTSHYANKYQYEKKGCWFVLIFSHSLMISALVENKSTTKRQERNGVLKSVSPSHLDVIFQDLRTVVLLYGSLRAAHISSRPPPGELHALDKLNFSVETATRVSLTFKYNMSLHHPFKMALAAVSIPADTAPYTIL